MGDAKSEKEEKRMGKMAFFSRLFKRKEKEKETLNKEQELNKADAGFRVTDKARDENEDTSKTKDLSDAINSPNQMTEISSPKEGASPLETNQSDTETEDKQAPFIASQLTLEDVEALSPDDSIAAFLAKGVSKEVKRAALDKLFQNPVFNVRDGLNDYDLDYSRTKKLTAESAAELRYWGDKLVEKSKQHLAESNESPSSTESAQPLFLDENQKESESLHQADEEKRLARSEQEETNQLTQTIESEIEPSLTDKSEKNKY